jgi:hypothetical protein
MVARAVGEAVILPAKAERAAALAAQVEEFASARDERVRVMAVAERLTWQSAASAEPACVDGGTETRHDNLLTRQLTAGNRQRTGKQREKAVPNGAIRFGRSCREPMKSRHSLGGMAARAFADSSKSRSGRSGWTTFFFFLPYKFRIPNSYAWSDKLDEDESLCYQALHESKGLTTFHRRMGAGVWAAVGKGKGPPKRPV